MNQICNYVDYCNAHCACSKILMHLNVDLLVVPYMNMGLRVPQIPSEEAAIWLFPSGNKVRLYGDISDRLDQLSSLFSTRLENCVLSPYFGVSLVFPFVSWTMLETMATQSPVTEDLLPPSMAWACPVSCAVGVCSVLPLRFLLHLMMCTDVLSKHPKRQRDTAPYPCSQMMLPYRISFWATSSGMLEPCEVSGFWCFNKGLITKVSVCTC